MKQLRKLLTMGVLLLMLLSLSACQKEEGETGKKEKTVATKQQDVEDAISTENAEELAETESIDAANEATGTFDFEKVRQNIVISGKKVSMPFCLDDLGEGYEFNEIGMSDGLIEHQSSAGVFLPDGNEIMVSVKEDKKEDIRRSSDVVSLWVDTTAEESVSIDGIKVGSNAEYIKEKLGEPTKISQATFSEASNWYYECAEGRVNFAIEDEKVFVMTIDIY